ncbi:MAG TPA: hypothetical protein VNC39_04675 [Acidocella sp.]|jgi:hypothetical protein|uniref:hypothetical protein n=1 Tax=Acidocella sp. TaxID=50710 RepID=UPI002C527071|nr:hypothetical protein [Acidocella sp.]HVE21248.1 hypothetical protein [Acidocella sp.]
MKLWHFSSFAVLAGLAGCSSPPPPQYFPPLTYSYLPPLVLKVATLNIVDDYVPTPDTVALLAQDPAPPAQTLMTMLRGRVVASGAPGTGTVTIQNASVHQVDGTLTGAMTVDVTVASADGHSTGYAEATVSASRSAPGSDDGPNAMPAALYGLTKQLMENMNVQLQYQMQHNLSGWLSWSPTPGSPVPGYAPAAAGAAVQTTPLTAPPAGGGGAAAAPVAPAAPGPAYPEPQGNLIPPGYPGSQVPPAQ